MTSKRMQRQGRDDGIACASRFAHGSMTDCSPGTSHPSSTVNVTTLGMATRKEPQGAVRLVVCQNWRSPESISRTLQRTKAQAARYGNDRPWRSESHRDTHWRKSVYMQ